MPYFYTGDTTHQFFQKYQQVDCAIDDQHVTGHNPTGCLDDLQSAITTPVVRRTTPVRPWPSSLCRRAAHPSPSALPTNLPLATMSPTGQGVRGEFALAEAPSLHPCRCKRREELVVDARDKRGAAARERFNLNRTRSRREKHWPRETRLNV
jgi:hypothetical protein